MIPDLIMKNKDILFLSKGKDENKYASLTSEGAKAEVCMLIPQYSPECNQVQLNWKIHKGL